MSIFMEWLCKRVSTATELQLARNNRRIVGGSVLFCVSAEAISGEYAGSPS
jgi:hypothetical protein